jgi:hypothetical protein
MARSTSIIGLTKIYRVNSFKIHRDLTVRCLKIFGAVPPDCLGAIDLCASASLHTGADDARSRDRQVPDPEVQRLCYRIRNCGRGGAVSRLADA